jgi:hypothetical protein
MNLSRLTLIRYLEVAELVYTSNTFHFADITAYWSFQRLVAPRFFQSIGSIRLSCVQPLQMHHPFDFLESIPPWDIVSWTETWQDIAHMRALKRVRVYVVMHNTAVDVHHEGLMFSPLKAVQNLEEFEVWTNWEKYELGQPGRYGQTWPFILRRDILDMHGRQRLS